MQPQSEWRVESIKSIRLRTPSPFHKGNYMTQEDLATLTGFRQGMISELERGKYFLSADTANIIAPHFASTCGDPLELRLAHNLWVACLRIDEGLGPRAAHYLAIRVVEMTILTVRDTLPDQARQRVYHTLLEHLGEMTERGYPEGREELETE